MAICFLHSCDAGDTALGKFSGLSSSTVNTTNPRFAGANSLVTVNPNLGAADTARRFLTAGQTDDLLIAGMAFRMEGNLSGDGVGAKGLIALRGDAGATTHLTLAIVSDGSIRVRRGTDSGTILGTSAAGVITLDTWRHLAIKSLLHDSTGTIDIQVDGVSVLALTGLDTKNAGTATVFDQVEWGGGSVGSTTRMRDFFILNGLGTQNIDFKGDCKVTYLPVDADLTPEEWTRSAGTDSFALVDETDPNSDTDYIESSTEGLITRLGITALTDTTHEVYGIQTSVYAKKDDAGSRSFRIGFFSDATLNNGSDHVQGTSYANYFDVFELDPDGDIPLTPASLSAAAVQVEVRP